MNKRVIFPAIVALAFAGGANLAIAQSGHGGVNAVAAPQPLQVYQLLSGPTWVYYKNGNRYRSLAYANHVKIFNKFTAVSFANTASQPIQQITFELAAYSDDYHPVLGPNGQTVVKQLVASGPFAPGTKHTLVNANVVWSIPPGYGLGCVLLNGMQIVYADGTSVSVSAADVGQYLARGLSNQCGIPPRSRPGTHTGWAGPTPFIAGVYPARWMLLHDDQDLHRQPYVPPSASQPLCAVGGLLAETCVHSSEAPDSQDAM